MSTALRQHSTQIALVVVFLFLAAGIGLLGYSSYEANKKKITEQTKNKLRAIVTLKVDEISRWRRERLADAHVIIDTPLIAGLVEECIHNPAAASPLEDVLVWMKSYKERFDYYSVSIIDAGGVIRLSDPEGEKMDQHLLELFPSAMRQREPVLCDIQVSRDNRQHIDLLVPLLVTREGDLPPVGMVLLQIDPNRFLYPLIQSWPIATPSAETMLVRREGNEVVCLNATRRDGNNPNGMRWPIGTEGMPEAAAARGFEGITEGNDYRGTRVIAAIKHLPDTTWFIITKIDADQMYASVHERASTMALLLVLLITAAGVTLGLVWSYQKSQLYLKQYKTETEKLEIARRYEYLTRDANDIIILVRQDGRIVEANQRAVATYSYPLDEFLRLDVRELETPEGPACFEDCMRLALKQDGCVLENVHRRRDGSRFEVEISARVIELSGENHYLQIIRDISERKQAERALREARESLERRVCDRTAELLSMNEHLYREIDVRKRAEAELRAVSHKLAETEETEKRRLSRELHDRVGQNLTALNFNITTVMNLLPADADPGMSDRLRDSQKLVEETVVCVRDVMADLRPPLLDDYGLAAVLRWYCREFSHRSGIPAAFNSREYTARLPLSVEMALFRIAQESLTNVMRHSGASHVMVEIETTSETVSMSISDDGVGFNPATVGSPQGQQSGWGMVSMRERAEMVGARLLVESEPGRGTTITVQVAR